MFEALNKAKSKDGDTLNFWHEKNPRCPHCGETLDIAESEAWELCDYRNEEAIVECPACNQDYTVGIITEFSYSTCDC